MKKMLAICLAVLLSVSCLSGCGKENEKPKKEGGGKGEPQKVESTYDSVLTEYYNLIDNVEAYDSLIDGKIGVMETAQYFEDKALDEIGYLYKDINSDDVPELLIGMRNMNGSNSLFGIYTLLNDKPTFVLEGRSRSSYSLMKDDKLFYRGSNGAAYSIFGVYALGKEADLVCEDFYFTYDKTSYTDIGFFHNTTGVYDKSKAEELKITDDEFWAIEEKLIKQTVELEFIPFSSYEPQPGGEGPKPTESPKPMVPPFCGAWTCTHKLEGDPFVLQVVILTNKTGYYKCGPAESEFMVDYKGDWAWDAETITFTMKDSIEGGKFSGVFKWELKDNILKLTHISGDAFLYNMKKETYTFYRG